MCRGLCCKVKGNAEKETRLNSSEVPAMSIYCFFNKKVKVGITEKMTLEHNLKGEGADCEHRGQKRISPEGAASAKA